MNALLTPLGLILLVVDVVAIVNLWFVMLKVLA